MEFKILALQVKEKGLYLKNLKEKTLYKFTQDYAFEDSTARGKVPKDDDNRFFEIKDNERNPPLDIYGEKSGKAPYIHLTALLGKNGSGKSSLLELVYLLIYCLSERRGYIKDRQFRKNQILKQNLADHFLAQQDRLEEILSGSLIELYYKLGDNFYVLSNLGTKISLYRWDEKKWRIDAFDNSKFFYTICVNYSHYGLNSRGDYFWLDSLFHKNDGYKTPIVITPFRNSGNIDVNIELHLSQTRLLSNAVNNQFKSSNIFADKQISQLEFTVVPANVGVVGILDVAVIYRLTLSENKIDLLEWFETFITTFEKSAPTEMQEVMQFLRSEFDVPTVVKTSPHFVDADKVVNYSLIRCFLAKYILTKIIKICTRYEPFKQFTKLSSAKENGKFDMLLIGTTSKLAAAIKSDNTHVTLKLKQAINAFLFNYFSDNSWLVKRNPENLDQVSYTTKQDFSKFTDNLKEAYNSSSQSKKSISQFIPTGFFRPTIFVSQGNTVFPFAHMSSGEQQMIHSIHSIIYHILNLDSLHNTAKAYNAINLILDEIELYYHPELQRDFIKNLITSIRNLDLKTIKAVNMIFSTHSPFILSDIPHRNVLRMREGVPEPFSDEQLTFGANIHEMLADSFFLDDKLIGAYAESKIQECVRSLRLLELEKLKESLKNKQVTNPTQMVEINRQIKEITGNKSDFSYDGFVKKELEDQKLLRTIRIIGEPVVRYKLLEMYEQILEVSGANKAQSVEEIRQLMEKAGISKEDL